MLEQALLQGAPPAGAAAQGGEATITARVLPPLCATVADEGAGADARFSCLKLLSDLVAALLAGARAGARLLHALSCFILVPGQVLNHR